ncbi:MAG: PEP-CTERM/exosortase system-associated acyltransferase [Gammaproteobacteria bacterium]|jgi:N-acyl amino acid synthase of PEP-CTERM/exosortase system|nr:PEP-CTERM/exosortase system-associated acyltransferase [Gammaproteobacteria bacterium]
MFDSRFETVLADTPAAREIHHRIRFLVYCLEMGYENASAHPDGLERDAWDDHSAHFLVRRRDNGEWIAAMRLVLPGSYPLLPIQSVCKLDRAVCGGVPQDRIAEVSRLCIVEQYRRRPRERELPYELVGDDAGRRWQELPVDEEKRVTQRRHGPEIMLGLLLAAAEYSREFDLAHWFFLTTPALCRMIEQYGVPLQPAGAPCQHRGERHPYFVDLTSAWGALWKSDPRMTGWLGRRPPLKRYSEIVPPVPGRCPPVRPVLASAS